jgi:acetyltransferase EpsM
MIVIIGGNAGAKIATEIFKLIDDVEYVETYWKEKQTEQKFLNFKDSIEYLKQPKINYFVATGDNKLRETITNFLITNTNKTPLNCIHQTAFISPSAKLGYGNLISPGAIIHINAQIGNGTIINTKSIIEHDCIIDDYSQISPGAVLCGYVKVKKRAFISANSTIIPYINIGKDALIAAGASVITDVEDKVMVAGNPAKIKKYEI